MLPGAYSRRYPAEWAASLPFWLEVWAAACAAVPELADTECPAPLRLGGAVRLPTVQMNLGAALDAHRDGRDHGAWAVVTVLRDPAAVGGELTFPELGAAVTLRSGGVLVMRASEALHAVTPVRGFRLSLVMYMSRELARLGRQLRAAPDEGEEMGDS